MNKPIETADDFLDEVIAFREGKPDRRRDTMAISRIQFIREIFPVIFAAGHASGVRHALKK